jgi:DNA-binding NarL/FixJ family response regulator
MGSAEHASSSILIADEDAQARSEIADALGRAGFDTDEAGTGDEALERARLSEPRLVILEIALQGLCGYEVCHRLRHEFGEGLPIVFLSGERRESFDRVAGLLIGADDYLVKPVAPDELLVRVRRLIRRKPPIGAAIASRLTRRELEVLRLLAEGLNQKEIALRLFITPKTVGTHIEHVLRKLGVGSRAQAVALAYRQDIAEPSS